MGKSSGSDKTTVVSRHDAVPFGTLVGDFSSVTVSDGKGPLKNKLIKTCRTKRKSST